MSLGIQVKLKMLARLKRELARLERTRMEMPNEEIKLDIDLHRELINFVQGRLP